MRLIFFGSDSFAVPSLERLDACAGHSVEAVVGRPDAPAGRGLRTGPTPLVQKARELSLEVIQPERLDRATFSATADTVQWDAGVVVAYGALIPRWLLDVPARGFVNLHPSLLPRYRGAAPVERALMNGASITGVTTIMMNERLDAGGILMHEEEPIYEDDTTGKLKERLAAIGARGLEKTLDALEADGVEPVPQEEDKATYAPSVASVEGNIDWSLPAESVDRMVRALNPSPGAFTYFRGKRAKIWSARPTEVPPEDRPGTLMNMGKEGFLVNTGTDCVQVVTIQPEGKSRMSAGEFSRGSRLLIGERFTSEP